MLFYSAMLLFSVHPEMIDFGSEHLSAIAVATAEGLSVFATAGIVALFRGLQKSACAVEALAKSQKRRSGPKDAISGWTPIRRNHV